MADSGTGEGPLKGAILIAGPTASGKSALALELARRTGGAVVNTDSMQVYDVLRVLTARPDDDDLKFVPHHLFGHVDPAVAYSTGMWQRDVKTLIGSGALQGRRPIFVGGTGLYFRALLGGLSEMPNIPADIRDRWRDRLAAQGAAALHAELQRHDPETASRLKPGDGQRIVRALEVREASGRSIAEWQRRSGAAQVDADSALRLVIDPDRDELHRRIEERLRRMVREGGPEEVRALLGRALDPALPAMKAIGVREFSDVLTGRIGMAEAVERAAAATRQYSKRQSTWFRNQLGKEWLRLAGAHDIGRVKEIAAAAGG